MNKKFNKGEWSEFYVFIKILSDNKIFLFDENLNYLSSFYEIIKIIRKELTRSIYIIENNQIIKISENNNIKIEKHKIIDFSVKMLELLKNSFGSSFAINEINNILQIINSEKIKSGTSYDKSDIKLIINDTNFLNKEVGFNIKSYLGNPPTLLNSSQATNFIYSVDISEQQMQEINKIETRQKIRDRVLYLKNRNIPIKFEHIENNSFYQNMRLIDLFLPNILAEMVLNFYSGNARKIKDLASLISNQNNFFSKNELEFKVKSFLLSIGLGMVPAKQWDGFYNADSYIVVKNNGEIGCFDILNKKILANYLYDSTKFDTPSSSRHDFGYIYQNNNNFYIKLNLQIRF